MEKQLSIADTYPELKAQLNEAFNTYIKYWNKSCSDDRFNARALMWLRRCEDLESQIRDVLGVNQ